jgi:hypothetical protein
VSSSAWGHFISTVRFTEVFGGKAAREAAEQVRILEKGGIKFLQNARNPIGAARGSLLPQWAKDELGY